MAAATTRKNVVLAMKVMNRLMVLAKSCWTISSASCKLRVLALFSRWVNFTTPEVAMRATIRSGMSITTTNFLAIFSSPKVLILQLYLILKICQAHYEDKYAIMTIPKLIKIEKAEKVIFVGDTHGDFDASQKVIRDYLKPADIIVFLGDYVDRGSHSKENLDFLLEVKEKNPNQIYLLQGNHEGHHILKFSPAEFWQNLSKDEYQKYSSIVEKFPLAVIIGDLIALHGVLPDVTNLKEINQIKIGSKEWQQISWGDFSDEKGGDLGIDLLTGRPKFGRDYFSKLMERLDKKVLIRSHQPDCPQFMFDDRCLTIFTSSAYTKERTITILDCQKGIKTARDLEIIRI